MPLDATYYARTNRHPHVLYKHLGWGGLKHWDREYVILEISDPRYIDYFPVDVILQAAPVLFNEAPKQMERHHRGKSVLHAVGMNRGHYANIS